MFKHLFASMKDMLSETLAEYPSATPDRRRELAQKLRSLKSISDECIEEWLLFEEQLAPALEHNGIQSQTGELIDPLDPDFAGKRSDRFIRAQGYYKLHMFDEAIDDLKEIVQGQPDFNLARGYLAMAYYMKGEVKESYAQFHLLSRLTDNLKLRAISYNAMGCIHARQQNLDKAGEYFDLAYRTDPVSVQPLLELGVCEERKGGLSFAFSSRG